MSSALLTRRVPLAVVAAAVLASLVVSIPGASAGTGLPGPVGPAAKAAVLDPIGPYVGQNTCDPVVQPGVKAMAALILAYYGRGRSLGILRSCAVGGESEHKEGRAFDWGLNAFDAQDKAAGDAYTNWLSANNGENARRVGIMYVIWNRRIWSTTRALDGWRKYNGASAHTDHVHMSFTWPGAEKQTSFWTGQTSAVDYGPCVRYAGHPAPVRAAANPRPCPLVAPSPVVVTKATYWYGAATPALYPAQAALGLPQDGAFGGRTRNAVLAYQRANGLPVTGALDPMTWAKLVPATVVGQTTPKPVTPKPTPPKPTPTKPTPTKPVVTPKPKPVVTPKPKPKPVVTPKPVTPPKSRPTALTKYKSSTFGLGARGTAVREAQIALGLPARYRTGYFGKVTLGEIKRLQAQAHLPMTGKLDRRTWDALERRMLAKKR